MMLRLVRRAARRNQRCKHFPLPIRQNLLPVSFCHPNQMDTSKNLPDGSSGASEFRGLSSGRGHAGGVFGGVLLLIVGADDQTAAIALSIEPDQFG
jgi:hypothetical protein